MTKHFMTIQKQSCIAGRSLGVVVYCYRAVMRYFSYKPPFVLLLLVFTFVVSTILFWRTSDWCYSSGHSRPKLHLNHPNISILTVVQNSEKAVWGSRIHNNQDSNLQLMLFSPFHARLSFLNKVYFDYGECG